MKSCSNLFVTEIVPHSSTQPQLVQPRSFHYDVFESEAFVSNFAVSLFHFPCQRFDRRQDEITYFFTGFSQARLKGKKKLSGYNLTMGSSHCFIMHRILQMRAVTMRRTLRVIERQSTYITIIAGRLCGTYHFLNRQDKLSENARTYESNRHNCLRFEFKVFKLEHRVSVTVHTNAPSTPISRPVQFVKTVSLVGVTNLILNCDIITRFNTISGETTSEDLLLRNCLRVSHDRSFDCGVQIATINLFISICLLKTASECNTKIFEYLRA